MERPASCQDKSACVLGSQLLKSNFGETMGGNYGESLVTLSIALGRVACCDKIHYKQSALAFPQHWS